MQDELDRVNHQWMGDELENGIPEDYWGLMSREEWQFWATPMESAIALVTIETLTRGINVQRWFLDFVAYGMMNENGDNLPVPRMWRGQKKRVVVGEAWTREDVRMQVIERLNNLWGLTEDEKVVDNGSKTREDVDMMDVDG